MGAWGSAKGTGHVAAGVGVTYVTESDPLPARATVTPLARSSDDRQLHSRAADPATVPGARVRRGDRLVRDGILDMAQRKPDEADAGGRDQGRELAGSDQGLDQISCSSFDAGTGDDHAPLRLRDIAGLDHQADFALRNAESERAGLGPELPAPDGPDRAASRPFLSSDRWPTLPVARCEM